MVSFIHHGSEITTWMGYNFKTKSKSTKSQATSLRKTSFLNFKLQIIRLSQRQWSCTPTHKTSYFYSYTYEKSYLAVHFTKECFFVKLLTGKLASYEFSAECRSTYHLFAGDTSLVSIFSLYKIKMSKLHRLFILETISCI